MKILWLCSWYPSKLDPYDGDFIERHAKALSLFARLDVVHVVQNQELLKNAQEQIIVDQNGMLHTQIAVVSFPQTGMPFLNNMLFNRRYQQKLRQLIDNYILKNGRPDIVHVHVPVKAGIGALWLKKKYRIPFVVTEHTSAYFEHIPFHYASRNRFFRFVTRKTFSEAAAVSSVSSWLLHRLQTLFPIRNTKLIRNTVDTNIFFPVEKTHSDIIRFLHVSMMVPLKNVAGIIDAFVELNKTYQNWELVLSGPTPDDLRQKAYASGLAAKIRFTGALTYTEVARHMQEADALVHFSHYENLPCVINEALCCGLPVISSTVGGIAELLNDTNGIPVEAGNQDALVAALRSFIKNRANYNKQEIAANASQQFSYQTIGLWIFEMYREVLKTD